MNNDEPDLTPDVHLQELMNLVDDVFYRVGSANRNRHEVIRLALAQRMQERERAIARGFLKIPEWRVEP